MHGLDKLQQIALHSESTPGRDSREHQEVWARIWATLQGPNLCPQMYCNILKKDTKKSPTQNPKIWYTLCSFIALCMRMEVWSDFDLTILSQVVELGRVSLVGDWVDLNCASNWLVALFSSYRHLNDASPAESK